MPERERTPEPFTLSGPQPDLTMSSPTVSVVMSVFNGATTLARTVESIRNQTLRDFELIIVNDGSTDRTPELLRDYEVADRRVHVVNQKNRGLTAALNEGCARARGEFIARQDCGDRSLPERLDLQVRFLHAHPDVVAVGAGIRRMTSDGELLGVDQRGLMAADVTSALQSRGIGILHAASMFRRDAFASAGGTRVVLPVPGGASSTRLLCLWSSSRIEAM